MKGGAGHRGYVPSYTPRSTMPCRQAMSSDGLQCGVRVYAHGLKAALHLNGEHGTCKAFVESSGRWAVRFDNGEEKSLKPENLVAEGSAPPQPGMAHRGKRPRSYDNADFDAHRQGDRPFWSVGQGVASASEESQLWAVAAAAEAQSSGARSTATSRSETVFANSFSKKPLDDPTSAPQCQKRKTQSGHASVAREMPSVMEPATEGRDLTLERQTTTSQSSGAKEPLGARLRQAPQTQVPRAAGAAIAQPSGPSVAQATPRVSALRKPGTGSARSASEGARPGEGYWNSAPAQTGGSSSSSAPAPSQLRGASNPASAPVRTDKGGSNPIATPVRIGGASSSSTRPQVQGSPVLTARGSPNAAVGAGVKERSRTRPSATLRAHSIDSGPQLPKTRGEWTVVNWSKLHAQKRINPEDARWFKKMESLKCNLHVHSNRLRELDKEIGKTVVGGANSRVSICQFLEDKSAAEMRFARAEERKANARKKVQSLEPGPDFLAANQDFAEAHREFVSAEKEKDRYQKVYEAQYSKQSIIKERIQESAKQDECLRRIALHEAQKPPPEDPAFAEAKRLAVAPPAMTLRVRSTEELTSAVKRSERLVLDDICRYVKVEWSFMFADEDAGMLPRSAEQVAVDDGRGDDSIEHSFLSLKTVLNVLEDPEAPRDLPDDFILAVKQRTADVSRFKIEPGMRFLRVNPKASEFLRVAAARQESASSSDLLRAYVGLSEEMRLDIDVRSAVQSAIKNGTSRAELHEVERALPLRRYQVAGLQWLASNADNSVGSLLADDMGLGKTMQAIALLLYLRANTSGPNAGMGAKSEASHGNEGGSCDTAAPRPPALVVAPYSVLSCWERELSRWAPTLRRYIYHGAGRSLQSAASEGVDVVLTTYGTIQRGQGDVQGHPFSCVLLDESQAIKNSQSQTSKAVKKLTEESGATVRVALSGTPVENRLAELYSLFEFLNPGLLGTRQSFNTQFERVIEKPDAGSSKRMMGKPNEGAQIIADGKREVAWKKLHAAVEPFVLRRTKADKTIAPDLPEKLELEHHVDLVNGQKRLYSALVASSLDCLAGESVSSGGVDDPEAAVMEEDVGDEEDAQPLEALLGSAGAAGQPSGRSGLTRHNQVLSMMHSLQQACNHPYALPKHRWSFVKDLDPSLPEYGAAAENSAKTARLLELLGEILEEPREKALVFTQYLTTLDLLASTISLAFKDIDVARFHGSLNRKERDSAVKAFMEDQRCAVMVLTVQAGGVGLTLTAATHVIHFDRCWNPAKEAQATDRAHRIGQLHPVVVHRIIATGTLEERLAAALEKKRALASSAIRGTSGGDVARSSS